MLCKDFSFSFFFFFLFFFFSFGGHFVQWSGTILAILVEGHPRNIVDGRTDGRTNIYLAYLEHLSFP